MKHFLNSTHDFIKKFDQFGVQIEFQYSSKERHKTIVGSFFTLLLNAFLVYKLVTSVKDIILKENLELKIEEIPTRHDDLAFKDFFLGVCNIGAFQSNNSAFFDGPTNLLTYGNKFNYGLLPSQFEEMPLTADACEEMRDIDPHKTCRCLKFDNTTYLNATGNLDDFLLAKTISVRLVLDYSLLDETMKSNMAYNFFSIVLYNNYVNSSDYYSLLNTFQTVKVEQATTGFVTELNYYYDKLQIDIVNDAYSFGLLEPEKETRYTYSLEKEEYRKFDTNDLMKDLVILDVNVKHSNTIKLFTITTFSLEAFLGKFGGYFQIIFVIFCLISEFWNNFSLERKIKKTFRREVNKVKNILTDIDNQVKRNTAVVENEQHQNYLGSPIKAGKACSIEMADLSARGNFLSKDKSSCNLMKEKNDYDKISEDGTLIVNLKISKDEVKEFVDKEENKIQCVNVDDRFENENKEIDILNKNPRKSNFRLKFRELMKKKVALYINEKYYSDLVDDFINQFDFEKLYFLIKEIKLIKYFSFDEEKNYWINHLQKVPFNIEKFDEFVEKIKSNKQNAKESNLDNFERRLADLRKFFINYNHS